MHGPTPTSRPPRISSTYVSADELERADARLMGYAAVLDHPSAVSILSADDELVVDYDHVLFGDFDAAVKLALDAARTGATVGIHTHHPQRLPLAALASLPRVTIAKTHRELRAAMQAAKAAA